MPSFEHKKLIEAIKTLDESPSNQDSFAAWIQAPAHLDFLRQNANSDELVIYASGEFSVVYSAVVPNDQLATLDQEKLLHWYGTPYRSIASYVYGGGRDDVWLERLEDSQGNSELSGAIQLVFGRAFEGWTGSDQNYFEINQEYTHVTGIHWRPEERAYCRFDDSGDLDHIVSITDRSAKIGVLCVSFKRDPLEEYMAATNSTLVRRFDFTLLRRSSFNMWPDIPETVFTESDQFFYRQKVDPGTAAYTTGVQLITPRRSKTMIFEVIRGDQKEQQYVEFIAHDWRNNQIITISTDPKSTTNYFEAHSNSLPYELSPAFFKPEVILKYKTDSEKYTVSERDISCRAAWHLEAYDVNEAGQIFAYICYLRNLPYAEQLHWKAYNEQQKAGISERAITNDFKGEFTTFVDPLRKVLGILRNWNDTDVSWWTLREARLLERVNTPLTSSRDEWAEAFMNLAKLVIEGFEISMIRSRLEKIGIKYDKNEKSIALLEKLIAATATLVDGEKLNAMRTVQFIRTKVKGHASGQEVEKIVRDIIAQHENFTNHFKDTCAELVEELKAIANLFE